MAWLCRADYNVVFTLPPQAAVVSFVLAFLLSKEGRTGGDGKEEHKLWRSFDWVADRVQNPAYPEMEIGFSPEI